VQAPRRSAGWAAGRVRRSIGEGAALGPADRWSCCPPAPERSALRASRPDFRRPAAQPAERPGACTGRALAGRHEPARRLHLPNVRITADVNHNSLLIYATKITTADRAHAAPDRSAVN